MKVSDQIRGTLQPQGKVLDNWAGLRANLNAVENKIKYLSWKLNADSSVVQATTGSLYHLNRSPIVVCPLLAL
jgi:hypothetical protein